MQVVRSVGHFKAVNCLRVPLVERKTSISIMGSGPLASLEVIHCAKLMESEHSTSARTRLATIARHMSPSNCCSTSHLCGIQGSLETQHGGIRIEGRVRDALMAGQPVVALESTIISHGGMEAVYIIDCFQGPRVGFHLITKLCTRVYGQGMPYPQNFQVAKEVESIVRQSGVTPATIAIIDGIPCIGLMEHELEKLAQLGPQCVKTSRRNIAYVMAKKLTGATTVSGTMFLASKVGIHVFVTGGIGGVHRHGETTMDVSADLTELGRTAVTVVCAGVKSILDIPRTLEYLETQGVTVIGYGMDEFPAFFTPQSGCQAPCRADTPEECAAIIGENLKVGLQSGILIGVPIPSQDAAMADAVESAIQSSLMETKAKHITGAALTPYILMRVNELTGGASLSANIALIRNNALVGSQIAVALADKLAKSP